MNINIADVISDIQRQNGFSGSVLVKNEHTTVNLNFGYADRSDQRKNNEATRYGIASGCKLFTAIAICQLAEKGKISFDSTLSECLDIDFQHFDKDVTVHQLLTHTSGIADYFDEEVMTDFEELWITYPMYHVRRLKDFLPLFQNERMKFQPGESFHYNNAGYILLGLIIEQATKLEFSEYVQDYIFKKAKMTDSGYFTFDSLPSNTALGYIDHPDGTWKTNIYSLPVKGGADGGAFVTAADMEKLWEALFTFQLLSEEYTSKLIKAHIQVDENNFYGYGIWIKKTDHHVLKYHVMGYDPGVSFHSAYYPETSAKVVVCSNKSEGAFEMMTGIEAEL